MRGGTWALLVLLGGSCEPADSESPEMSSTGAATVATTAAGSSTEGGPPVPGSGSAMGDGSSEGSSGGGTTGAATTMPPTTAGSGNPTTAPPPPTDPACSVQEVTEGDLVNPLDSGDVAGKFPVIVADALEDYCGCHTLNNNNENVKYEFLKAPGGTLFLTYDDMSRSFDGGTLGEAMAEQTLGYSMPPGSCSFPGEPSDLLDKWFLDGWPDGATFEYP